MKYERLTKKTVNGYGISGELVKQKQPAVDIAIDSFDIVINRLAELEDKIENGTIIELPCKVGDKVWVLERNNKLIKMEIVEYSLREKSKRYYAVSVLEGYGYWLYERQLNEDWFLIKAEAEQTLKELHND